MSVGELAVIIIIAIIKKNEMKLFLECSDLVEGVTRRASSLYRNHAATIPDPWGIWPNLK